MQYVNATHGTEVRKKYASQESRESVLTMRQCSQRNATMCVLTEHVFDRTCRLVRGGSLKSA
jgi:hypothetical protein